MSVGLARHPLLLGTVGLVVVFTLAPLVVAVAVGFSSSPFLVFPPPGLSLRWFGKFLADPGFLSALRVSLVLAAVVALIGTLAGTALACGLRRLPKGWLSATLRAVLLLPLLFPVIVIALALLLTLSDIDALGSPLALVLAHLLIVVPLVTVMVGAGLGNLDCSIEEAAASLGASPFATLGLVVLPQIRAAIAGSAMLAFLFSFNDVTFAAFVGGPAARTLPLELFAYVRYQINPLIGAVSALFVGTTVIAILVIEWRIGFARLMGLRR